MRRLDAIAVALAAVMAPPWPSAEAADWDHDANIDAAVLAVVATYRQGGMAGLEPLVEDCYLLVDAGDAPDERLRQFEYCAGMDLAAVRLHRREAPATTPAPGGYFGIDSFVGRVGRLSTFLDDPNVGNQVIRAWSQAADEALARHGD